MNDICFDLRLEFRCTDGGVWVCDALDPSTLSKAGPGTLVFSASGSTCAEAASKAVHELVMHAAIECSS